MNIFEVATRTKMRFPYKGLINVEDLWDLSVRQLDSIFKTLNAEVRTSNEESLLSTQTAEDKTLSIQIDIIKYVVSVKLEEAELSKNVKAKAEKKQKLMTILESKREEELQNLSPEEIQKMLDEL